MKNTLIKLYITAIYLLSTFVMFAQPANQDNNNNLEGNDAAPATPIDHYLGMIAVIGIIFAFLKFRATYLKESNTIL